ncbi:hypothetical protein LCGC14_3093480, partial [marine sediment metagenome]
MARLSLRHNPKWFVLVNKLGVPEAYVRGHMEMLWESAHFRDDPFFKSSAEVEAIAGWQGEKGSFCEALTDLDSPWLDKMSDGGYEVHDYEEHVPRYVQERRRQKEFRSRRKAKSSPTVTRQSRDRHVTPRGESRPATKPANPKTTPAVLTAKEESLVQRFINQVLGFYPKAKINIQSQAAEFKKLLADGHTLGE